MATLDEAQTVQAVTDRLLGPMKVWVLVIDARPEGGDEYVTLWYDRGAALAHAKADMETNYKKRPDIDRLMAELDRIDAVQVGEVRYELLQREIK